MLLLIIYNSLEIISKYEFFFVNYSNTNLLINSFIYKQIKIVCFNILASLFFIINNAVLCVVWFVCQ